MNYNFKGILLGLFFVSIYLAIHFVFLKQDINFIKKNQCVATGNSTGDSDKTYSYLCKDGKTYWLDYHKTPYNQWLE